MFARAMDAFIANRLDTRLVAASAVTVVMIVIVIVIVIFASHAFYLPHT